MLSAHERPTNAAPHRHESQTDAAPGSERDVVLRVPSVATLFQAMRHGEFAAFMPTRIAEPLSGPLRTLRTDLDLPEAGVIANRHPRMNDDARHVRLREKPKSRRREPDRARRAGRDDAPRAAPVSSPSRAVGGRSSDFRKATNAGPPTRPPASITARTRRSGLDP